MQRLNPLLVCACFIAGWSAAAVATVEVSGEIKKDTRWNREDSPIVVKNDLLVPRHVRLAISPGTWILVERPSSFRYPLPQRDRLDSLTVSIRVEGILVCEGKRDRRIVFCAGSDTVQQCAWYGIVLDKCLGRFTEISFTDVAGACHGVVVEECGPLIRNCVFEFNNVGLTVVNKGDVRLFNCVIVRNFTAGVRITSANPRIYNSIIAFNGLNGVWCDRVSRVDLRNNCLFGNGDGAFLDCDPSMGVLKKTNRNNDSTDHAGNIFMDPVFAGSAADSLAVEHDITLPTDRHRIADTSLARVLYPSLSDSSAWRKRRGSYPRYWLSTYSPCIDAGHGSRKYRDEDGSRNDMGIYGWREVLSEQDGR